MPDRRNVGFTLTEDIIKELDEHVDRKNEVAVEHVSRSAVAREALLLGLEALDKLDDDPRFRRLHPKEKRSVVRQALLEMDDW